jgi:hypothetical protein
MNASRWGIEQGVKKNIEYQVVAISTDSGARIHVKWTCFLKPSWNNGKVTIWSSVWSNGDGVAGSILESATFFSDYLIGWLWHKEMATGV